MSPRQTATNQYPLHEFLRRQSYFLVAGGLAAAGVLVLLVLEPKIEWAEIIGSTLIATGLLSATWQAVVDRWQRASVVDAMRLALTETPTDYGLREIRFGGLSEDHLTNLLVAADEVLAVCLFDKRWQENWGTKVKAFIRDGGTFKLVAPDPANAELMAVLAARHGLPTEKFRQFVLDLLDFFLELVPSSGDRVQLRVCSAAGPSYTGYLFSRRDRKGVGVVRIYKHRMGQGGDLTEQTFAQDGKLYAYFLDDYNELWEKSSAYDERRIHLYVSKLPRIAVIGPGLVDDALYGKAEKVGELLAGRAVVVCGGLGGVMEAVSKGVKSKSGGKVCAFLPEKDLETRNAYLDEADCVATGQGERRNLDVIDGCGAVIALGCNPGTLIEIAYAARRNKPVFALDGWSVSNGGKEVLLAHRGTAPDDVVSRALDACS